MKFPERPLASHAFSHRSITWRKLLLPACAIALGLAITAWHTSTAATPPTPGPNVNLNEPVLVTVSGPVEVQGAVEVVNDALKVPFAQREFFQLDAITTSLFRGVSLPAGKRIVIETVTIRSASPVGQDVLAALTVGGVPLYLTLQPQATFGSSAYHVGTHPVTLRMGASETNTFGAEVSRSAAGGTASFVVGLFGYMEDI